MRVPIFLLGMIIFTALVLPTEGGTAEEKFVYDDKNRRDPLMKLVTPEGIIINYDMDLVVSDFSLEGIVYDRGGDSLAIVNGRIVQVDDKIGLFTVTRIEQNKIVLTKGQESFIFELKSNDDTTYGTK